MLKPKPIIPMRINGVVELNNNKRKNATRPNPIQRSSHSFCTFVESHAVKSLPAKIIIHKTLAVACESDCGSNPVSLK